MKLYLIRHGETNISKKQYISMNTGELNEIGIKQAKNLFLKLKKFDIDLILTSPYKRSRETAKIINSTMEKKVIIVSTLKEKRFPSEIEGKDKNDLSIKNVLESLEKNETNPKWHYSDEENLSEVINRSKKFIRYLKKLKKSRVVIISHKFFLVTLLFVLKYENPNILLFRSFYERNQIERGEMRIRAIRYKNSI